MRSKSALFALSSVSPMPSVLRTWRNTSLFCSRGTGSFQYSHFSLWFFDGDLAGKDVENQWLGGVAPAAIVSAENMGIVHAQDIQQSPQLHRMQLHRSCRGQNHGASPGGEFHPPLIKHILLWRLPDLWIAQIFPANLMSLVPKHATEPLLEEVFGQLPIEFAARRAQHHRRRHDGNFARAIENVVFSGRMKFIAFGEPAASSPEGAGRGEFINHFLLPLRHDGLGRDNQHWLVVERADEFGKATHLERLSEADAIGQQVTCAASRQAGVAAMFVEGFFYEILLVIPKAEQFRAGRHFGQNWPDIRFLFPIANVLNDGALTEPSDLFDDELADGKTAFPQGIKFLLHPLDAFGRVVFPNQFVIF